MKKRSLWRNLGFLALWLFIGGVAILKFAPEFFSARDAAPNTAAMSSASDVPPLDEAPAPHFYATETTTAGSDAPTVDRTSDDTPISDSCFALPGAAAPAAAPELGSPAPWQSDPVASPGAAAPESDVAYGPNMASRRCRP